MHADTAKYRNNDRTIQQQATSTKTKSIKQREGLNRKWQSANQKGTGIVICGISRDIAFQRKRVLIRNK